MFDFMERIDAHATDLKRNPEEWLIISARKQSSSKNHIKDVLDGVLIKASELGLYSDGDSNINFLPSFVCERISDIDQDGVKTLVDGMKKNTLVNVALVFDKSEYFGSGTNETRAFFNFMININRRKNYKPICSVPSYVEPFTSNKQSCIEKKFCFECNNLISEHCDNNHSCLHRLLCLIIYGWTVYEKDPTKRILPNELLDSLQSL